MSFDLYIFSSWNWDPQDIVAEHLHEEMIRSTFYEKGLQSKTGMVRSKWGKASFDTTRRTSRILRNCPVQSRKESRRFRKGNGSAS